MNLNVIIDVLKSCTIIILYACHDTMILHLHYRIVRFLRYVLNLNSDFQVFRDFIFTHGPSIWLTWANSHARYACYHII